MSKVTQSIEVDVPVRTAYNQWTQFEQFPKFMSAVKRVDQLRDDSVHFVVSIGGHEIEYDAEIVEQEPDRRIAWRSRTGRDTGGVVTFERLGDDRTRITLELGYAPEGVLENVGDLANVVGMQARSDLDNFKQFIERQGHESGGWRGEIHKGGPSDPTRDFEKGGGRRA